MTVSARRPEGRAGSRPGLKDGQAGQAVRRRGTGPGHVLGALLARNPVTLGGGVAFAVALSFVSANAVWNQTESHAGTFFPTRALPSGWSGDAQTTGAIARPAPRPAPDSTLRLVQVELRRIGLYDAPADGLPGPGTRRAVAAFQARNGLKQSGEIDAEFVRLLAEQAGAAQVIRDAAPSDAQAAAPGKSDRQRIEKIQAGLKAFGIDGVEVDGLMGARTRAGLREFQAMFGLQQTGEADDAVLARMQETGLAN